MEVFLWAVKEFFIIVALVLLLSSARSGLAVNIAVFGDNSIDDFLNAQGHVATLVSDAQIATPGFLSSFDVFLYTRYDGSFGTGLSAGAAAQVQAFVTGNVVLFPTDLADSIGPLAAEPPEDPSANTALLNAVGFASTGGKGYIGEFGGAGAAMTTNAGGFYGGLALGLVPGTWSSFGGFNYQPFDIVQPTHPVAAGLPDPWVSTQNYRYIAGISPAPIPWVVAVGPSGSSSALPTILATPAGPPPPIIPEPSTYLLFGLGALGLIAWRRRQAR